jgi:hypothetical protein
MIPTKEEVSKAIVVLIACSKTGLIDDSVKRALWVLFPNAAIASEYLERLTAMTDQAREDL